jgi:hypothetical protein
LFVLAELAEKQGDFELAGKLRAGIALNQAQANGSIDPERV